MGLELHAPHTYQTQVTEKSWPKCFRCTMRMLDGKSVAERSDFVRNFYPVEKYGIVDREKPATAESRYRLVILVGCHGAEYHFSVEIPRRWGETSELVVMGRLWAFVPAGPGRVKTMFVDNLRKQGAWETTVK